MSDLNVGVSIPAPKSWHTTTVTTPTACFSNTQWWPDIGSCDWIWSFLSQGAKHMQEFFQSARMIAVVLSFPTYVQVYHIEVRPGHMSAM